LPRKLAIKADEGNKAVIVQMKAASVRRSAKEKTQAEELAKQLRALRCRHAPRGRERSALWLRDVERYLASTDQEGFNIDRRKIQLHER